MLADVRRYHELGASRWDCLLGATVSDVAGFVCGREGREGIMSGHSKRQVAVEKYREML